MERAVQSRPDVNTLTEAVIGAAMRVHTALGPGLLESAYEICLCHELFKLGLRFEQQLDLPVVYDGVHLDAGYRIDLLVEDEVIVELKCVEQISDVHKAQLLSYLKLSGKHVGLIINFHVTHPEARDQAAGRRTRLGMNSFSSVSSVSSVVKKELYGNCSDA